MAKKLYQTIETSTVRLTDYHGREYDPATAYAHKLAYCKGYGVSARSTANEYGNSLIAYVLVSPKTPYGFKTLKEAVAAMVHFFSEETA
jgi:hypothetical protein